MDKARQQLFCMHSHSLDKISPTSAALKQHILRASYQGSHVWGQVHLAFPELPSPAEWGRERNGHGNLSKYNYKVFINQQNDAKEGLI